MTAEENIVRRVCKELGITQRELAERMGGFQILAIDPGILGFYSFLSKISFIEKQRNDDGNATTPF